MHRPVSRQHVTVLAVALLVVLSGCNALPGEGGETQPTTDGTGTTPPGTETDNPDSSQTPTPADPSAHPWADTTVRVAVEHTVPGDRDIRPLVREALTTWNGTDVAGGEVSFVLVADSTTADLDITVEPRITQCGTNSTSFTFTFCMPRLGPGETTADGVSGSIAGLYDDETFVAVAEGAVAQLLNRDPGAAATYPPERYTYADPWPESSPVVVNVSTPANESRSLAPLVRETIAWWDAQPETARDYSVEFVVRPDADEADLQVRLVDDIESCGTESDTDPVGCADLLDEDRTADGATVRVEQGYTPDSTAAILKHEFGHIYGREHGETPVEVMEPTTDVRKWPVPNATEREVPWNDSTLSVYLDSRGGVDADRAWDDIRPALTYYEDGANGWLDDSISFTRIDEQENADIVVTVTADGVCGFTTGGVCGVSQEGVNLDSDPAFERYTFANMTIDSVSGSERAWFAGFGLAFALGVANQSEMPTPLQDVDNADERWWETA